MPHLVILYTPTVEKDVDMSAMCRSLADAMLAVTDDSENSSLHPLFKKI